METIDAFSNSSYFECDAMNRLTSTSGDKGYKDRIYKYDSKKFAVVHKDFVLDYTSPLKNVLLETVSSAAILTHRYVHGLEKLNTKTNYGKGNSLNMAASGVKYEILA